MAIHMEIYGLLNIRRLIDDLFQSEIRIWFRLINELIGPLKNTTFHNISQLKALADVISKFRNEKIIDTCSAQKSFI